MTTTPPPSPNAGTVSLADRATGVVSAAFEPFEPRLYDSRVMHLRLRPKRHQFRYTVWCLWLDIDRLENTAKRLRWFSIDRFNLVSFRRRDHAARDGSDLRPWVEDQLRAAGIETAPTRIMLLSFPRILGRAFNPLSIYYCYSADEHLSAIVYQVKNTFGDQHPYVTAVSSDDGAHRHAQEKEFFVSPFIDMTKTYRFAMPAPNDRLAVQIKESDDEGEYLIATWNGEAQKLSDTALRRRVALSPLAGLKIMFGIHWEALRLALKGVRFLGHPGDDNVVQKRTSRHVEAPTLSTKTPPDTPLIPGE